MREKITEYYGGTFPGVGQSVCKVEAVRELESDYEELEQRVLDTETALTGAISYIEYMKCCSNCSRDTDNEPECEDCIRSEYKPFSDPIDNWKMKETK